MTEAEWQASADPMPMVEHLGDRLSDRKLRLYACAAARMLWGRLADERSRQGVETAERYSDGLATPSELLLAFNAAENAHTAIPAYTGSRRAMRKPAKARAAERNAASVARNAADPDLTPRRVAGTFWGRAKALVFLAGTLRDLFGPLPLQPPRPRNFPAHVTGLAEACDAAFPQVSDQLLILADALDELGEADAAAHCREPGHVKGCYVLDWILRKG